MTIEQAALGAILYIAFVAIIMRLMLWDDRRMRDAENE